MEVKTLQSVKIETQPPSVSVNSSSNIHKRQPRPNEGINLSGIIEKINGNKLTINIVSITLTEITFSGSTSGSEFNIPITIDL